MGVKKECLIEIKYIVMEKQKETRVGGLNGYGDRRKEWKENMRRESNIKVHLRVHMKTNYVEKLPKKYT